MALLEFGHKFIKSGEPFGWEQAMTVPPVILLLILTVRALLKSSASNTGNVMTGLLIAVIGLFILVAVTMDYGFGAPSVGAILFTAIGIPMLIPMDSPILSFLRPFRLEKSVLPQYQPHPQMPMMSPVPIYHQPAPIVYQQPSPVYQQQFVGQQAYPIHPGSPPTYDAKQ